LVLDGVGLADRKGGYNRRCARTHLYLCV
jgi:hypothetical protein